VGGIAVPGDEVGRAPPPSARGEQRLELLRCEPAISRAADFKFGEFVFEPFQDDCEELLELRKRAGPHLRPEIGLVPDFPVADIVMKAVRPPPGVVADDSGKHLRVPLEILRHQRVEMLSLRVLDAGAEPVEHLRAEFRAPGEILVGCVEIVVGRVRRVRLREREKEMGVDDALPRVPQRPVVGPRRVELHVGIHRPEVINVAVRHPRNRVGPVEGFADTSGFPAEIRAGDDRLKHDRLPSFVFAPLEPNLHSSPDGVYYIQNQGKMQSTALPTDSAIPPKQQSLWKSRTVTGWTTWSAVSTTRTG